jgi:hypothetical protein
MSTTGHRSDVGSRFDLDDQHAETINNVGGDQNLFWTGVLLLGLTAWATVENVLDAQQAHTLSGPYTDYVSGPWKTGLGLIFAGAVVPRLALRLFGRSAGAG